MSANPLVSVVTNYGRVVRAGSVAVWLLAASGMDCTPFITCSPATLPKETP